MAQCLNQACHGFSRSVDSMVGSVGKLIQLRIITIVIGWLKRGEIN